MGDGPHGRAKARRGVGACEDDRGGTESGTFWVAQHAPSEGKGYDLLLVNADGKVFRAVQRHPSWWVTDKIEWLKPNPTSRVVDIREVADGIVVVALAHPRPDWKRFPIQPNGNGSLRRYFTRVDVIDTRTAEVIGTVDVPGYPRRLLDDRRIASYVEDEDGIPYLDVWAYSFRR